MIAAPDSVDTAPGTTVEDGGDSGFDGLAHYAIKKDLVDAMVFGTKIRALCGKLFTPTRDPDRYPVCGRCKAVWEGLPSE